MGSEGDGWKSSDRATVSDCRPAAAVVFDFRMGREREGPKRFLGNFEGILQSDGYAVYDHVGGPKIVHAACWAHYLESVFIWNEGRGSRLAL